MGCWKCKFPDLKLCLYLAFRGFYRFSKVSYWPWCEHVWVYSDVFPWWRWHFTLSYDCQRWLRQKSSRSYMFCKIVHKNIVELTEKHLCLSLFLIKLRALSLQLYLKKVPVQVFYCEFCEICKNIFFTEHLRTTASTSNFDEKGILKIYTKK